MFHRNSVIYFIFFETVFTFYSHLQRTHCIAGELRALMGSMDGSLLPLTRDMAARWLEILVGDAPPMPPRPFRHSVFEPGQGSGTRDSDDD